MLSVVASGTERGGHLRHDNLPGQRVDDFSLEDLEAGRVHYVDGGEVSKSSLGLRVSLVGAGFQGGRIRGNAVTLKVETFDLQVFEVNNTGLVVTAGTATAITSYNLTFTTNAPEQGLNIRYDYQYV